MEVKYQKSEHNGNHYLIQSITMEKETIIVIMRPNENELNDVILSTKTIEKEPSSLCIIGNLFNIETKSIADLLCMHFNRKFTVSCNVQFDNDEEEKSWLLKNLINFITEHSL